MTQIDICLTGNWVNPNNDKFLCYLAKQRYFTRKLRQLAGGGERGGSHLHSTRYGANHPPTNELDRCEGVYVCVWEERGRTGIRTCNLGWNTQSMQCFHFSAVPPAS